MRLPANFCVTFALRLVRVWVLGYFSTSVNYAAGQTGKEHFSSGIPRLNDQKGNLFLIGCGKISDHFHLYLLHNVQVTCCSLCSSSFEIRVNA